MTINSDYCCFLNDSRFGGGMFEEWDLSGVCTSYVSNSDWTIGWGGLWGVFRAEFSLDFDSSMFMAGEPRSSRWLSCHCSLILISLYIFFKFSRYWVSFSSSIPISMFSISFISMCFGLLLQFISKLSSILLFNCTHESSFLCDYLSISLLGLLDRVFSCREYNPRWLPSPSFFA